MAATSEELPAAARPSFLQPMKPRLVSTPTTLPFSMRMPVTSQFWMMSTPRLIGAARIAPGHRIVAHRAAAPLQQAALDRESAHCRNRGTGYISRTASRSSSSASTPSMRMALPRRAKASRCGSVWQRLRTPRCETMALKLKSCSRPFPQLHRPFVEGVVAGQHVVGADDRGVAADVAGAEPALLQHRDIGEAMLLGEVIGGRQPMPAAADDDDVVFRLGLGLAPGRRPVLVAGAGVLQEREDGVFHAHNQFQTN